MPQNFWLAPWEVVHNSPENRRGEVALQIESPRPDLFEGVLRVCAREYHNPRFWSYHFVPENGLRDGTFALSHISSAHEFLNDQTDFDFYDPFDEEDCARIFYHSSELSAEEVQESLFEALQADLWGRVFFFNEKLQQVELGERANFELFVGANGLAQFFHLESNGIIAREEAIFRWSARSHPQFLAARPALEVLELIRDQLKQAESEASFAWRWLKLSEEQRIEICLRFGRDNFYERRDLLHWAAILDSNLWEDGAPKVALTLHDIEWTQNAEFFHVAENGVFRANKNSRSCLGLKVKVWFGEPFSHPPRDSCFPLLERCAQLATDHFQVQTNDAVLGHLAVKQWRSYELEHNQIIKVATPTFHEKLEARLNLENWLQARNLKLELPDF